MKRLLMLLSLATFIGTVGLAPKDIDRQFPTSPGKRLTLDLKTGGSIEVSGWDRNLVSVHVDMRGRDADDCVVDFAESDEGISIMSRYKHHRNTEDSYMKFTISVPKKYDVKLETMGGGVSLHDLEGTYEGKTMGGEVRLADLHGSVDLMTMGGNIAVENSDLHGRVKTMGGKVELRNVTGGVNGQRASGEGRPVEISSMGGGINVESAPGGASVTTMGGDIHVGTAARFVRAKTMGGGITVDAVDGSVNATTMGGDVTVTMTGDPAQGDRDVSISSMGGDVTLTVPPGLSMGIDIDLTFTEDAAREYKIISDFPLTQKTSKDWDTSQGTPRKHVYGRATVGGGKNTIRLRTVNGDITLRKSS